MSSTVTSTVMFTMENEPITTDLEIDMDLEEAIQSQGDDEVEEGYGQKYKTMSEDRTDRGAAQAKQRRKFWLSYPSSSLSLH